MSPVDAYIATLSDREREEFERIRRMVRSVVPDVEEGVSYAMPAYMWRGKPFLSVMVRKKFLAIYPFSGKVIELLSDQLKTYETTKGSIHYTLEAPIPEELLRVILSARLAEISNHNPTIWLRDLRI